MTDTIDADVAAVCKGVRVPPSPFLNETRIRRINEARYEGDEIAGAMRVVTASDRVLEMGAGLGVVGAVMALNCKPERIVSFEANPNMIPHIRALYDLNNLTDRIEVRNEVLISAPDRPAEMTFYLRNSFLGSSLIDVENRATRPVAIPTADFAAVRADLNPTVLVLDIEGGELDLLRHADLTGIRAIVIEFHPEAYGREGMQECKQILRDAGFVRHDDISTRTVWTCSRDA